MEQTRCKGAKQGNQDGQDSHIIPTNMCLGATHSMNPLAVPLMDSTGGREWVGTHEIGSTGEIIRDPPADLSRFLSSPCCNIYLVSVAPSLCQLDFPFVKHMNLL